MGLTEVRTYLISCPRRSTVYSTYHDQGRPRQVTFRWCLSGNLFEQYTATCAGNINNLIPAGRGA